MQFWTEQSSLKFAILFLVSLIAGVLIYPRCFT